MSKNFNKIDFIKAINKSQSHAEAMRRLGYRTKGVKGKYKRLFDKLQPDISHFTDKIKFKLLNPGLTEHKKEIARMYHHSNKSNINYRLSKVLRSRLANAINNNWKSGSAVSDLGCSIEKLKLWLEMHWKTGMTWGNYGKYGWHIDHKQPLSSFNLENREELLKACHFTNLQPLWAEENCRKSNKF